MKNGTSELPPIRQAIAAWSTHSLPDWALMRAMVSHQPWWMLASRARPSSGPEPRIVQESDGLWLHAFDSEDEARESEQEVARVRADTLMAAVHDGLDGLALNPGGETEIRLDREWFPTVRRWALADRVARIVRGLDHSEDGAAVLRRYAGWHLLVVEEADGRQILLAPDAQGRRLVAVFTAEDCLKAFVARHSDVLKGRNVTVEVLGGDDLFAELARLDGLDGIVFDCAGPLPPKAVQAKFAEEIDRSGTDARPSRADARALALRHARRVADVSRPLLASFLDPTVRDELVLQLRPQPGDAGRVFRPELADAVAAQYREHWARKPPRIKPQPDQCDLTIHPCPAGMLDHDNMLSRPFPEGYRALAPYLIPNQIWICWRYSPSGASGGVRYDGLVWLDGRAVWFPKPYRVVGRLLS